MGRGELLKLCCCCRVSAQRSLKLGLDTQVAPLDQNLGLDVLFFGTIHPLRKPRRRFDSLVSFLFAGSFILTLLLAAAVILSLPVEWAAPSAARRAKARAT